MTRLPIGKMNLLLRRWPKGTVATQTWLNQLGISSKLADWHVQSGWLERFGPRAFNQPDDAVDWKGGLYALQTQLGLTVHVGARSALELQGRAHFIPMGKERITLVSDITEQLPAWFKKSPWGTAVTNHCLSLFESIPDEATSQLRCAGFQILTSSAERAIMEQMRLVRNNQQIEHVHLMMEGLGTLRPPVVQTLLEHCQSVRVKRFFLWSAEAFNHTWFARLDSSRINLGHGKRQIYKGGSFNQKYQITVPNQTPETLLDV